MAGIGSSVGSIPPASRVYSASGVPSGTTPGLEISYFFNAGEITAATEAL